MSWVPLFLVTHLWVPLHHSKQKEKRTTHPSFQNIFCSCHAFERRMADKSLAVLKGGFCSTVLQRYTICNSRGHTSCFTDWTCENYWLTVAYEHRLNIEIYSTVQPTTHNDHWCRFLWSWYAYYIAGLKLNHPCSKWGPFTLIGRKKSAYLCVIQCWWWCVLGAAALTSVISRATRGEQQGRS